METTAVTSSDTAVSSATTDVNAAVESIQEQVDIASDLMSKMGDYIKKFLPLVVFALIIIFIGYIVTKLITKVIDRAMKRSKIDVGAKNFLLSVIRIGLYTVVLIMALSVLKVPISSIITILGAAGLAVSLALQTCLYNLAGGFNFLGLDLLSIPKETGFTSWIIIIPILCLVTSLGSQILTMRMQGNPMQGQQGCMKYMMLLLPLITVYISYIVPGAVGFYWVWSTIFGFVQTLLINKFYSAAHMTARAEAEHVALLELKEAKVQYDYQPVSAPQQTTSNKKKK